MKKINIFKNIKYSIFTLTLIVTGFVFTNPTEAGQYTYGCADGGTVTSNVAISPTGPFSAGSTTPFDVFISSITSTCSSRAITLTAQNNTGTVHTLVNQTFTGTIGPFFDTVNFAAPSTAGTYAVHFITGVDEPQNPIYVVVRPVQVQGPGSLSCAVQGVPGAGTYLEGAVKTAYEVDFYNSIANYNAGIKYDVTGQNLRLRINYYSNTGYLTWAGTFGEYIPPTTTLTSVLSGETAYAYGSPSSGLITEYYVPGQYVPEDCEYSWWGQLAELTVLDGLSETVPYQLIPQPPTASIGGTYGVYTGESFNLSWFSTNATSCTGTNFSTSGATSGSLSITPSGDTTYTISCSNVVGSANDSITVYDLGPRPVGGECKEGEECAV
jgi:hypothetical protein